MAKIIKLKWTPLQRELAAKVAEGEGFEELVEAGYTRSFVSKVLNSIKAGQNPPSREEVDPESDNREPLSGKYREPISKGSKFSGGGGIEVGKITITPENWGMTQYGAILILDTYNKAKKDITYGGTIGEFLCDICEFYRRVLNYKEVVYDGRESGRREGAEEDGGDGVEQRRLTG